MNKSKLTRTLMTAVSVVALSAVAYGCSSGVSDADHQAALDAAKAAEEQAAAAAAAAEEAAKKIEEAEAARIAAEEAAEAARIAAEEAAEAAAEKIVDAAAMLTAAGTAADTAEDGVDAAKMTLGGADTALKAAITALNSADTGMRDQLIAAVQRYFNAKADHVAAAAVYKAASETLGDAITKYEARYDVLKALDAEAMALTDAETAITALKAAKSAAETAVQGAGKILDPLVTAADGTVADVQDLIDDDTGANQAKLALTEADGALSAAMSADTTAKTRLDTANTALAAAVAALTALDATATAADVAAANGVYQAAVTSRVAAKAAADGATAALENASTTYKGAYAALMAADPEAVELMVAKAKIAELEDAAKKAMDKAEGDLAELQTKIDAATTALAALQKQLDDAEKAAEAARIAAVAAGYTAALGADDKKYAALTTDDEKKLGVADRRASEIDGTALTVKRSDSVTMKAKDYMAQSAAPASIGTGWTGQVLVKDKAGDKNTVTATVYTDIEAPTQRALDSTQWSVAADANYFADAFPGAEENTKPDIAQGKATIKLANGPQTWPGNATGSKIPTTTNTTMSILAADPSFAGTLNGISGTFRCSTGDCKIKKVDATKYDVSDNLTFIASVNAMVNIQDADFMTLGWWIEVPDNGAATAYEFGSFAVGATEAKVTNAMEGTATYKGPAVGAYAEKKHGAQIARSGSFTAEAALTANFFDKDLNESGYISGSVSKFMDGGESLGDWTVILGGDRALDADGKIDAANKANPLLTKGASGTFANLKTDDAKINAGITSADFDGLTGSGEWQAQFSNSGTVVPKANDAPVHVTGTFDATVGADVLNVSGAFGATKQ